MQNQSQVGKCANFASKKNSNSNKEATKKVMFDEPLNHSSGEEQLDDTQREVVQKK